MCVKVRGSNREQVEKIQGKWGTEAFPILARAGRSLVLAQNLRQGGRDIAPPSFNRHQYDTRIVDFRLNH
jgi:hypothetical protein